MIPWTESMSLFLSSSSWECNTCPRILGLRTWRLFLSTNCIVSSCSKVIFPLRSLSKFSWSSTRSLESYWGTLNLTSLVWNNTVVSKIFISLASSSESTERRFNKRTLFTPDSWLKIPSSTSRNIWLFLREFRHVARAFHDILRMLYDRVGLINEPALWSNEARSDALNLVNLFCVTMTLE